LSRSCPSPSGLKSAVIGTGCWLAANQNSFCPYSYQALRKFGLRTETMPPKPWEKKKKKKKKKAQQKPTLQGTFSQKMLEHLRAQQALRAAIERATPVRGLKWAKPESAKPKETVMDWTREETSQFLQTLLFEESAGVDEELNAQIEFLCKRTQVDLRLDVEDMFDPARGVEARLQRPKYQPTERELKRVEQWKQREERLDREAADELRGSIISRDFPDLWKCHHKAQVNKRVPEEMLQEAAAVLKELATQALQDAVDLREFYALSDAIRKAQKENLVDTEALEDARTVLQEEFRFLPISEQQKLKKTPGAVYR